MKRFLCVYMPGFRLQRILVRRSGWAELPVGLYAPVGRREVLVACTPVAEGEGVKVGLTVTQARARCHSLKVFPADPPEEKQALAQVAEALGSLSPRISMEVPDAILADITTTTHLFQGKGALQAAVWATLEQLGYQARAVVTDGPDTAWALAAFGRERWREFAPGDGVRLLASLSLAALRPPENVIAQLESVGIRRIGQLLECPVETLNRRFGAEGARLHRLARGCDDRALECFRPETPLEEEENIEEGCFALDALGFVLKRILDRLEARMRGRSQAALQMELTLRLDPAGEHQERIVLSRPLRSSRALLTIWRERLQGVRLEAPVGGAMIRVLETASFRGIQRDLFGRAEWGGETLDELLARLTAVFGVDAIFSPSPINTHRPERGFLSEPYDPSRLIRRRVGLGGEEMPDSFPRRPSVLLPVPASLVWTGRVGDAIRWEGRIRRVRQSSGPERLSVEWWHHPVERDYHVLLMEDGTRWWVFRDLRGQDWYLHGLFE